ncbi:MAG: ATP-binding cassette domain-containing protein [Lutibacter sp.]|nr:ATP-binding cassette domain-containing protein [Lutibacter sp.]
MKNSQETSLDTISEEKATAEILIEIKNLKKSFGRLEVLKDISLKLRNGENLVVLGKSGSGKSVLIKCIVRLLNPDGGTINLLGKKISSIKGKELSEIRKKIGFLFQSGALYDSMTVKQNLEFPLVRIKRNLKEEEISKKINEVLENVGLPDVQEKMPSQLSGGMRKRISLARSIILDPVIMLYDEPTTGLDPVTSDEISELINSIQKKYKTSSIIITHDIACVRITADRIVMLHEGYIYAEGKLSEFEASDDPLIMSFFK